MIEALATGFYNKLIGGTALQTKLGGSSSDKKIYNVMAPQSTSLPYITFGVLTDTTQGIFGNLEKIESMTFWLNVFSDTSPADCFQIADLVATLMDNCDLTIMGYTSMVCNREFISSLVFDITTGVYQITLRYRLMASKD